MSSDETGQIKDAEEIFRLGMEAALKCYEKAKEVAIECGMDAQRIGKIDSNIQQIKKEMEQDTSLESNDDPCESKQKKIFKNAMLDALVLVEKWQEIVANFVVNPCDQQIITSELGDDFTPAEALRKEDPEMPSNCIGWVWTSYVLADPECNPGTVIAIMEGKPILKVSEMIAIADNTSSRDTKGKAGYAYEKAY